MAYITPPDRSTGQASPQTRDRRLLDQLDRQDTRLLDPWDRGYGALLERHAQETARRQQAEQQMQQYGDYYSGLERARRTAQIVDARRVQTAEEAHRALVQQRFEQAMRDLDAEVAAAPRTEVTGRIADELAQIRREQAVWYVRKALDARERPPVTQPLARAWYGMDPGNRDSPPPQPAQATTVVGGSGITPPTGAQPAAVVPPQPRRLWVDPEVIAVSFEPAGLAGDQGTIVVSYMEPLAAPRKSLGNLLAQGVNLHRKVDGVLPLPEYEKRQWRFWGTRHEAEALQAKAREGTLPRPRRQVEHDIASLVPPEYQRWLYLPFAFVSQLLWAPLMWVMPALKEGRIDREEQYLQEALGVTRPDPSRTRLETPVPELPFLRPPGTFERQEGWGGLMREVERRRTLDGPQPPR